MAEEKKTYPMLPVAHWWELRKKFKQSIPGVVTDSYLATVLAMKVSSARGNVLPYLKQLKIIDEEGKTLPRAKLWRDDEHYAEVCQAMMKEVYPQELLDAVPDPNTHRPQAESWFAHSTGTGQVAARRMATFYAVLAKADATGQPDKEKTERKPSEAVPRKIVKASPISAPAAVAQTAEKPQHAGSQDHRVQPPGININLQVHISADSTPDQIDQIFASMAKHIYQRA
jgi:hypothetical protein